MTDSVLLPRAKRVLFCWLRLKIPGAYTQWLCTSPPDTQNISHLNSSCS